MLKTIRNLLSKVINDIDAGNSNITESEAIEIIENIRRLTDRQVRLSKYEACKYLNISRATFDNYVREGRIPKGVKEVGFKEISWTKKDLDTVKDNFHKEKKKYLSHDNTEKNDNTNI